MMIANSITWKYLMRLHLKDPLIAILIVFLTVFGISSSVLAATITLAWDPNPPEDEVTGYKVYYGTASGKYGSKINVGNVTKYTITGLTLNQKYFFAVTAYDKFSNESDFSGEVSGFPKKEIELLTPNGAEVLKSGNPYLIQWKVNGTKYPVTKVNLYRTMNGGVSYALINPTPLSGSSTSYNWTVPTPLSNKKNTCYVKVVAYNGSTVVGADTSDKPFTIEVVKVIQPNGGETLSPGSSYQIQWEINGTKSPVTKVNLYYTMNGGASYVLINPTPLGGSSRNYAWTVPTPLSNKKNTCYVNVVAYNGSTVVGADTSDKPFAIEGVRLTSPNGGEVLKSGSPWPIQWEINGTKSPVTKVNLYRTMNGGVSYVLINPTPLDGSSTSYTWTVPTPLRNKKNTCYVKVVAYNGSTVVEADTSDKPFTIEVVKVIQPNGGETLSSGSSYPIQWEINGTKSPVTKVNLYYTMNGGTTWRLIKTLPGSDRSYNWKPTVKTTKTNCKIKVVLYDSESVTIGSDVSDHYFTILLP
jgi:ribosomal protein L30E